LPALPLVWALRLLSRARRRVWRELQPVEPMPAAFRTKASTVRCQGEIVSLKIFACGFRQAVFFLPSREGESDVRC
jgi:hypothetical protein